MDSGLGDWCSFEEHSQSCRVDSLYTIVDRLQATIGTSAGTSEEELSGELWGCEMKGDG